MRNPEEEQNVSNLADYRVQRLASEFADQTMDVYNDLLIGEPAAKMMYISLLAMGGTNGMGGVLLGPPGTGKSRLLKYGHEVVDGIEGEHVAFVPHRADLTGAQLVGEESEMERRHTTDEGTTTDTFATSLKPILHRGIKAVKFDEVNRTSPLALNAALDILQEGGVKVYENGRPAELTEFDLVVSSMNNYGTYSTNKLDPALLNRNAMGSFMGVREKGQLSEAGKTIWGSTKTYSGRPEIKKTITLPNLHEVRGAIDNVFMDQAVRAMGERATAGMLDVFSDEGIESGDGRISEQVIRVAKTLTLLTGHPKVTPKILARSFQYAMTARLGGDGERTAQDVDKLFDKALSRAA